MLSRDGLRLDEAFRYMEPLVRWSVVLLGVMFLRTGIVIADRVTGDRRARLQSRQFIREVQNGSLRTGAMRLCAFVTSKAEATWLRSYGPERKNSCYLRSQCPCMNSLTRLI